MSARRTLARKLRQHRQISEFNRAVRNASPSMQQELIAAAAHDQFIR